MSIQQLCIVGLGMMGGAIGAAARRSNSAARVIGVADSLATIERACAQGAVDAATLDLREGAHDADLIILCVPARAIFNVASSVLSVCREDVVLTDIGSSKALITRQIEDLIHQQKSSARFVGSHPITGSEKKGIAAAGEVKLTDAICVITPTPRSDPNACHRVDDFWKNLGMKTVRLSPSEHDAALARSSHLLHLASGALVTAQTDQSMEISGPGLRDMTRLAGSDSAMWVDIAEQNSDELSKALKEFGQEVLQLAQDVEMLSAQSSESAAAARERLFRFLSDARQRHDQRFMR